MNDFFRGSRDGGEWSLLDVLGFVGFLIGVENLGYNISQTDLDRQTRDVDEAVNNHIKDALAEIHGHLQRQDEKIERLLEALEENDERDREADQAHSG